MNEALDWAIHIAIAIIVGILIVVFVGQRTIVFDISMQPTLVEGDNLVVEKVSKRIGGLKQGDIIVFQSPEDDRQLVKRLVALEGDTVEIKDGKLYVNGEIFKTGVPNEPETLPGSLPENSKLTIPKGCFYALGDNRLHSLDCREFGPLELKRVSGRAIFRFYPFNKIGKLG
jgi:signal peptidase I